MSAQRYNTELSLHVCQSAFPSMIFWSGVSWATGCRVVSAWQRRPFYTQLNSYNVVRKLANA